MVGPDSVFHELLCSEEKFVFRLLSSLFSAKSRPITPPSKASARPRLECLEQRLVLDATARITAYGDIEINGGDHSDYCQVNYDSNWNYYEVKCYEYDNPWRFHASQVWGGDVFFHGNGGHDTFSNNTYLATQAFGGFGIDVLYGGAATDLLDGGPDNDYLFGMNAYDALEGGAGNDQLYGGWDGSEDYLHGDFGNDTLYGGAGADRLFGGADQDYLYGEDGGDFLHGGNDGVADHLYGGAGADQFVKEEYWAYYYGYWFRANRDYPADFSSADGDSYYTSAPYYYYGY